MDWIRIIDKAEEIVLKKGLPKADLAKILGVRSQYISDLKSGKSKNPGSEFTLALINQLGISPLWIQTGKGNATSSNEANIIIPLLTQPDEVIKIKPDPDWEAIDHFDADIKITIPDWLKRYGPNLRSIEVPDNRMAPLFYSGDIVIYESTGCYGAGIHIIKLNGKVVIRRLVREDSQYMAYCELSKIKPEPVQIYDVVGLVRAVIRRVWDQEPMIVKQENQYVENDSQPIQKKEIG
ncbi:XRE family transcriptional regulator [Sediminispirochaeta bajacaliforniensis]|uniref:XRE family transcriptional regulator n=1 Tax=Sediminispirochaeta bajacaliforniensis TaxID=148 RepID=UPI000360840C|nr:XRE family transcriptional regulator [Sediminispirochaeta bajacaliforniensis]